MISRSANAQPSSAARTRPISVPPLPTVSDMATMLMVHLLLNARTPSAATCRPSRAFVAALRTVVLEPYRTPAVWTSRFPGGRSVGARSTHRQARPVRGPAADVECAGDREPRRPHLPPSGRPAAIGLALSG